MQRLAVSGAVRPIYVSLGVKWLSSLQQCCLSVYQNNMSAISHFPSTHGVGT